MIYLKTLFRTSCLLLMSTVFLSCNLIGGAFEHEPQELEKELSAEAQTLMKQAFEGIDPAQLRDYHIHLLGMNTELNGTFVNEEWQSPFGGLIHYIQFQVYKSAAAITDEDQADDQYLTRLKTLIEFMPQHGKFGIMAFDYFHNEEGRPIKELSTFHVPNAYVMSKVEAAPDLFFPIISIHPYRTDALDALTNYAKQGTRFVKWLPNAMGIHPASERMNEQLEAYYRIMHDYDMTLISHTGDEKATEAEEFQHLGNPLFLKKPLDMGVKVVMAHVASLGECREEDAAICTPGIPYIDLAIDMLEEPQYEHLLFADISALTQDNRKDNLDKVLGNSSIHDNLINGSDYPLPAVNIVIQTRTLESAGYITAQERESLNDMYDFNPLLFDFVLKRTLRHTKTGEKFPASVFLEHPDLPIH
ncbi:amidohydrolase family protein [Candidatus Nitrospira salsa]